MEDHGKNKKEKKKEKEKKLPIWRLIKVIS
jgi:hypothetical protein